MNQFCHNCTYIKNDTINAPLIACPLCGCPQWDDRPPEGFPGARQLPSGGWTIDVTEALLPLQAQWWTDKFNTNWWAGR